MSKIILENKLHIVYSPIDCFVSILITFEIIQNDLIQLELMSNDCQTIDVIFFDSIFQESDFVNIILIYCGFLFIYELSTRGKDR